MRKHLRNIYLKVAGSFKKPSSGIHILNLHYVTRNYPSISDSAIFESFIKHLKDCGELISLSEAIDEITNDTIDNTKTKIALTFDDGFEECYTIIAPILEKYNIKATFFVNANYIESNRQYQESFNLRIEINTKRPMTWSQVIDLHKRGHLIGSHTMDHFNMKDLSIEGLNVQLLNNKEHLESRLEYKCEHFAWPYGQLIDFPIIALEQTEKYHKYIYSGTNYNTYFSMNKRIINRRHMEPYWPKSHINYFLSINKTINSN